MGFGALRGLGGVNFDFTVSISHAQFQSVFGGFPSGLEDKKLSARYRMCDIELKKGTLPPKYSFRNPTVRLRDNDFSCSTSQERLHYGFSKIPTEVDDEKSNIRSRT